VRVHAFAAADIESARRWYEQRRAGLGEAFVRAVAEMLARIASFPELYGTAEGDVRRGRIGRFPHVVYYLVLADSIQMLAVLHGSRDPRKWRERL